MINGKEINLAKHRLEQARECLRVSEENLKISLKSSVNRSYYCIFHTMRAVLALDKYDSKKHAGIIGEFRQRYIKTGKFSKHFSTIIGNAFEIRNESDYEDFYIVSELEAKQQLENANEFLTATENYINEVFSGNCGLVSCGIHAENTSAENITMI